MTQLGWAIVASASSGRLHSSDSPSGAKVR